MTILGEESFQKFKISDVLLSEEYCKSKPNWLFIFGDNDIHKGKKGQAVIRDLVNSAGIPTKKLPSLKDNAYYTDDEYEQNIQKINDALTLILKLSVDFEMIIFPKRIGTGLAKLDVKAPKTYKYLCYKILKLFGIKV